MPVAGYAEADQDEMASYRHLLGVYRAQYLLEAFGHRGNIYILENYDPEQWVQQGGSVFGYEKLDQVRSGQAYDEQIGDYNYKIRGELVKNFQEIKDYQHLCEFKDQTKKQSMTSKYSFYQDNAPIVVDSRPWIMRKALGEIPRVTNSVSFTELLTADPATGARVLKDPSELRALFERVPGLDFDDTAPSED